MDLQAAHRKALDVLNSLGLSDSLLRVIDRRQRLDKWITYGGMVRTCLRAFRFCARVSIMVMQQMAQQRHYYVSCQKWVSAVS